MNAHENALLFLHWFYTAFFIGFGLWQIRSKRSSVTGICSGIRLSSREPQDLRERMDGAMKRREQAEGAPAPIGLWVGIPSIALGIIQAFTAVQTGLLYSVLCLVLATATAAAYLRLRNSQRKRVAVLVNRTPASVIPPYWFAVAILSALSVLAYAAEPAFTIAGIFVCISSLLATAIAWRLTQLPAMLSGTDIAAEQAVDDRLRLQRSSAALIYALVQTFVFCTQAWGAVDHATPLELVVQLLNSVPWIAFGIWLARKQQARVAVLPA